MPKKKIVENKKFLNQVLNSYGQVAIITDGRSISQRLKLKALGLSQIPVYISDEWNSQKPDHKRFIAVMNEYNSFSQFCYIADNLSKDFVAPNHLKWITICLKGNHENIYSQNKQNIKQEYLPTYWINDLNEINLC